MSSRLLPLVMLNVLFLAAAASGQQRQLQYSGVNLSCAEFGQSHLPGTYNSDYIYPNQTEVDYFKSRGMNTVRLCFRWERLQHTNHSSLDATEFGRLHSFVTQSTAKGVYVILDPHNFARYYPDPNNYQQSAQGLIGGASVPFSDFADFWSRLAAIYRTNDHVIFNLMNEPAAIMTTNWVTAANAAITAIRDAGASNLVLVPGTRWTGAWTWMNADSYGSANAVGMLDVVDPTNNFAFDVHQYLDNDGSGTSTTIYNNNPMIGVTRLSAFTQWCRDNNRRGFLGEFAVANSTFGSGIGDETISNMLSHLEANADVWMGWTWWAAGPWWGGYMFTLEPAGGNTDQAAMMTLTNYITIPQPTLQITSGGQVQFPTWPRFVFQPQASPDLVTWTNYGPTLSSNGPTVSVSVPVGSDPAAFYRVQWHRKP
ncbi:MAG: glycoside hydrolase family 5 protein [Verrucomicrobiota bacterium]